jgi:hypothetical protein
MSITSRDADLAYMLGELGEDLSFGATVTKARFRVVDERFLEGFQGEDAAALTGAVETALIVTGSLPDVEPGNLVARVDGAQQYRVLRMLREEDGRLTRLLLGAP